MRIFIAIILVLLFIYSVLPLVGLALQRRVVAGWIVLGLSLAGISIAGWLIAGYPGP